MPTLTAALFERRGRSWGFGRLMKGSADLCDGHQLRQKISGSSASMTPGLATVATLDGIVHWADEESPTGQEGGSSAEQVRVHG